jgi:hypothetical protein
MESTDMTKKEKRRGLSAALKRSRGATDQTVCASFSNSSSGYGAHTYAENRGVVSGSRPREITIPTGSSNCGGRDFFIMICTERKDAPGTVGGTHAKAPLGPIAWYFATHCGIAT